MIVNRNKKRAHAAQKNDTLPQIVGSVLQYM